MAKYRQRLVAALVTVVGGLGVFSAPSASANPGDIGTIEFTCTASLNAGFPGNGGGTCNGSWNGVVVVAGVTYTSGTFEATFSYAEPCPPVTGTASGSVTLNGGLTTEYFIWTRVGLDAAILIADSPFTSTTVPDGAGTAAFAPTPPPPASALIPPNCTPKNNPQGALVVGAAAWI